MQGQLLEELEFNEGKRDGSFTWWHENGKVAMKGQFKNNKRTGKWVSWDKQGKRFTERIYQDDKVVAEDKELNSRTIANANATYEIMTPSHYSPKKKYPLVMLLHGGHDGILGEKMFWKADQLKELTEDYIFAFLQSSQVVEINCYNWNDVNIARKDLKQLYKEILQKYPIDTSQVIIMGMSQGGQLAIDAAINNIIPVRGFLACCPAEPGDLSKEAIKQAVQRGICGTILVGERDRLLPKAKEINALFKEMNLDHRFIVIPGLGHQVPVDSTQHFKTAAAHILNK